MLVYSKNPRFTHDVEVNVPVNGGFEVQVFKATFNVITNDEIQKFKNDAEFLERVLHHADQLVDEDKKTITYNDEVKKWLISMPYTALPLVRTYYEGVTKAKSGN